MAGLRLGRWDKLPPAPNSDPPQKRGSKRGVQGESFPLAGQGQSPCGSGRSPAPPTPNNRPAPKARQQMRGPGGIIPPGGVQGRRPCPCPNAGNPAWNRDRGLVETDVRESSGTEANSRASLSRRQGVKPTSPGERQPQRDSFQICAPSCRNPKNERSMGDVAAA